MKEYFIHRLWQWGLFDSTHLVTTEHLPVTVIHPGHYLQQQGPDFFNALLEINGQKWAGTVEIHLKSSDWYHHYHETDSNYDNVILHVVWEHDMEVFRADSQRIPVLELKHYVAQETLGRYQKLMEPKSWIYCENSLEQMDELLKRQWLDTLYIERLKIKSEWINQIRSFAGNDWEAIFFYALAKSFGLQHNGEVFFNIAKAISFQVVHKEHHHLIHLEALFLGMAGLLEDEFQEHYPRKLQEHWRFLASKYQLSNDINSTVTFYQVRPDNFPTLRLAQLAGLYHSRYPLFQKLLEVENVEELKNLLKVKNSDYWNSHHNFDKTSATRVKSLSDSFIQLLIINAIIPVKFAYLRWLGIDGETKLMNWMEQLNPESNKIISFFRNHQFEVSNALDSQALIHLKKNYCDARRCLDCSFGKKIMLRE